MRNLCRVAISGGLLVAAGFSLLTAADAPRSRMEITLERKEGRAWKAVDPTLVLASGDVVRFRFKANFNGFLYVTNYGTSGQSTLLFPREETGRNNAIRSGQEYFVPATESVLRIAGPAGYESVYWLVSPVALGNALDLTPNRPSNYRPPVLRPRCDDTTMRARGLCMDTEAGPRAVQEKDELPNELAPMRSATSRELTIVQQRNQAVVSPSDTAKGPVLYEFRLAHN
jgi:hypothetical protein